MTAQFGFVTAAPRATLRLEGLAALATAVIVYAQTDGRWGLFAVLFLAPDLSMLGYLGGARLGAVLYNIVHTYVGPIVLAAVMSLSGELQLGFALIWAGHIGFDRLLGYGLKYPSGFGHTHLGRLGRARGDAASLTGAT